MKYLRQSNVLGDYGKVDVSIINNLEKEENIKLPNEYCKFISNHNGASLYIDSFDFYDNVHKRKSCESIAFIKFENISETICDLLEQTTNDINDPDVFKWYKYFEPRVIPFGDTGGGDFICFDYRQRDDPEIILWCHDYYDENWNRISFIANNFEEFINMLHKCEDE